MIGLDPLHGYFALCGLSLLQEEGLLMMNSALGVSGRAHQYLHSLHQNWKTADNLNSNLKSCGLT